MIRAILACDDAYGIGRGGDLPWPNNPADLAWFKENTLNSTIVMGRNTWESLPFKPLPKRHNVVVSNTMREQTDIEVVRPDIYKSRCVTINMTDNVWIIGGAKLLNDSLDIIDEIWLSRIKGTYDCDTFLPQDLIETTFSLISSQNHGDIYIDKWKAY
jgi:dihydrofolate reductase